MKYVNIIFEATNAAVAGAAQKAAYLASFVAMVYGKSVLLTCSWFDALFGFLADSAYAALGKKKIGVLLFRNAVNVLKSAFVTPLLGSLAHAVVAVIVTLTTMLVSPCKALKWLYLVAAGTSLSRLDRFAKKIDRRRIALHWNSCCSDAWARPVTRRLPAFV